MKRYLCFAGEDYYPSGGWDDYVDSFDTLEEAVSFLRSKLSTYSTLRQDWGWCHIVDTLNWSKILETQAIKDYKG